MTPTGAEVDKWIRDDIDRFEEYMTTALKEQAVEHLRMGIDTFIKVAILAIERRSFSAIENAIRVMRDIINQLGRMEKNRSGLSVQMGRLDASLQILTYFLQVTPDADWLSQLSGKYDQAILTQLYREQSLGMSALANSLDIQPPYLTEVINRLVNHEFVERNKRGRTVFIMLLPKGSITARYLEQAGLCQTTINSEIDGGTHDRT